ncbi:inositol monophosphatase family protein [Streptomyces sp. NPDC001941]|uniref:inositol monophosphatase family protein n=1 Tax=Streptomyces sp. NPDC001941 TaxID=3154659 RepID=UPI0033198F1F
MTDTERLALDLARRAAAEIRDTARGAYRVSEKSGPGDLLTEADLRAEMAIRDLLREARPGDAVLAEESGFRPGSTGVTWIVDPLDGTANFVRDSPHYAVSVAAQSGERCLAAAIVRPADDQWMALREGAVEDHCAPPPPAAGPPRVAVALPYGEEELEEARTMLGLAGERYAIQRTGSAACDLLRVASGTLDAHVAVALPWWDTAAGHALVRAGGGTVARLRSPRGTRVDVSGRPGAVRELAALLAHGARVREAA